MDDEVFLRLVKLILAREKFPCSFGSLAALMEEVGELAQACLKVAAGKWAPRRIAEEAVHAVMAMRVAIDGDHSLDPKLYRED
jgi:hypothetical protein